MNSIKFMIADKEYIHVTPEPIQKDYCEACAECTITYVNEKLGINIQFGYTEAETFHGLFGFKGYNDLLNNKLFFDNNKRIDPGFEYNQYCQDLIKNSDVVDKYFFESNSHKNIQPFYTSWFYNDKEGNIIFEISPLYPWINTENAESQSEFIAYDTFMKNYKVIVHKIIPKKKFIEWNNQAKSYNPVCHSSKTEPDTK